MTIAFVLSGGGNLGAAQTGMLIAMEQAGIAPELVVGTSAGALNGAWIAGGRPAEQLADVWRSIRRADVFPAELAGGLLGFVGARNHLVSNRGLRDLLRRHLPFNRIEDAQVPFHTVATEVLTGMDARLSLGDATDAILASSAIPGILPPVTVGDRALMDGGVVNNTPISHALELGAKQVWVLATGYSCALDHAPRSSLGMALHSLNLIIQQQLARDVARYADHVDLRVVPPLCPISVPPTDFGQASGLIERARDHTVAWLHTRDAAHPALPGTAAGLGFHRHNIPGFRRRVS